MEMIKLKASVLIDRLVEDVFEFVTDGQNAPIWNSELVEVKKTSEGSMGVGTKYWMVHQLPIGRTESIHEVIEHELNRRFSLKITSATPVSFFYRYSFEPVGQGTKLSLTAEVEIDSLATMLAPIMTSAIKRRMKANFDTLKHLLEAGSS
jgi:hypothetical protein